MKYCIFVIQIYKHCSNILWGSLIPIKFSTLNFYQKFDDFKISKIEWDSKKGLGDKNFQPTLRPETTSF